MPIAAKIVPCLWFDKQAEEAAEFYVSIFPDSRIDRVDRSPSDYPSGKAGDVLLVEFTLSGHRFTGLNGGPHFNFTEAVSFQIDCADQAECDHYSNALSAVPEAEQCGWVKDRYGLSWQVVPTMMTQILSDPDKAKAKRVFEAMMEMKRLDIAKLEAAARG